MSDPFLIPVAPRPASAAAAAPDAWQRQHISALVFGLLNLIRSLFSFLPAVAALGLSGNAHYIPLAAAAMLGLHLISVTAAWLTTRYRIAPDSLSLQSGVFSRNTRQVGFDRIQDISIEQNFLARALGVAKLGVETGAGGAGDDFTLDPIALPKAEALRETLRAYRHRHTANEGESESATPSTAIPTDTPNPLAAPSAAPTLFTLPLRQLLLSGIFSPSLAVIAFVFALIGLSDRFAPFGFDLRNSRTWERIAQQSGTADWLDLPLSPSIPHIIALTAIISLIVAFLGIFTGIVRAILRDWDYRLTREARALRRTRGLTTRTDVAITIRRIQAAIITTGLIRQLFGWHELRLRSLASDVSSSDGGDHQALPFAQMSDIDKVLGEIALRPHWADIHWQRSHPLLILPPLLFGTSIAAAGLAMALLLSPFGWATVIGGLFIALMGSLAERRHFHAVDGAFLLIRSGLLRPSTTIIPASAIQSADIRDNFVYRRFGLATLAFGVPGISSFADDKIPAIPLGKAIILRDKFTIRNPSL